MDYQSILFSVSGSVATLTLNRPDKLNSFTQQMAGEVQDALNRCADLQEIRAVLLTGAGRGFCAGQDLAEALHTGEEGPMDLAGVVRNQYNPIIRKLRLLEKPVICAVNGVAAGAGANLSFACDITFAAESALFVQSFIHIGLIPDSGGTFFLPRLGGLQRASALTMLGEKITAAQAEQLGLIWKAVPDDKLSGETSALAAKLAAMPTRGIALIKKCLNSSLHNDMEAQLEMEAVLQQEAGMTYDFREGVKAFLEKRKPAFKGK